jgi:hypothetical protein
MTFHRVPAQRVALATPAQRLATKMKTLGNLILVAAICVAIFIVFMALRPATAQERPNFNDPTDTLGLRHRAAHVGTAWQCGRDYIVVTYFSLAFSEGEIWLNKKGPYGEGEEIILHQAFRGPQEPPFSIRWRPTKNGDKLYDRGKPCAQKG